MTSNDVIVWLQQQGKQLESFTARTKAAEAENAQIKASSAELEKQLKARVAELEKEKAAMDDHPDVIAGKIIKLKQKAADLAEASAQAAKLAEELEKAK